MRTAGVVVALCGAAALPLGASATLSSLSALHGISPALQRTLATASSFTCDGGAKRFALSRINDNYCDCDDGSDEPGTSACSHTPAVFHCANAGFYSQDVPTSRVNDGICDCCDGSDEYGSGANCRVTCAVLMEAFQKDKAVEIAQMEAGEADRAGIVAASATAYQRDQDARAALEMSIASLKVMLEQQEAMTHHEEQLEQAERVELLRTNKQALLAQLGLTELSAEQLGVIVLELSKRLESLDELLALIQREREAASVDLGTPLPKSPIEELEEAFRVRDEARQRETERIEKLLDERRAAREERKRQQDEVAAAAAAGGDADSPGVGGDAAAVAAVDNVEIVENDDDLVLPEVEERPSKKLFDELNEYSEHTRPEAVDARTKQQETSAKLASDESELRTLDAKLAKAYGVDRVLYSLRDACYETQSGEYTYSLCLFGDAKQSSTRLGAMQDVSDVEPVLEFTGGDRCWNGPERSLKVTLECGALPVELFAVDEPATCVYTAKLRTPVACDQRNRDRVLSPTNGAELATPHHVEVEVAATL